MPIMSIVHIDVVAECDGCLIFLREFVNIAVAEFYGIFQSHDLPVSRYFPNELDPTILHWHGLVETSRDGPR